MSVRSIGTYEFAPTDGADAYDPDQLVMVYRQEPTVWFCAPVTFRAPKGMPWGEFRSQMIDTWASGDPGYDPSTATDWRLFDDPFTPDDAKTLEELGIGHKTVVKFRTA